MLLRTLLLLLALHHSLVAMAETPIRPTFQMDADPVIEELPPIRVFAPQLLPLWSDALSSKEQDMLRQTAAAVTRAHKLGMPGLNELVPKFVTIMLDPTSKPAVRYAVARAVIELDSKESAAQLWDVSQRYDQLLRQLVEPALAEWNYEPSRTVWRSRLNEPSVRHRDLVLAVQCLGHVADEASSGQLRDFVMNRELPSDLRLEAARSAGLAADNGFASDAAKLASDTSRTSLISRICALRLLSRHKSPEAQALLISLAKDSEPAVVAAAMTRLNEIDFDLALPLAESVLTSSDSNIRQAAVETIINRPTSERMAKLAPLLDDVHPRIRSTVREALFRLAANPELNDTIRDSSLKVLNANSWRGQEQATLLVGALNHKPAADRLVVLLESERSEVMSTAAWALRVLAVPETLPAILDKALRQTEARQAPLVDALLDHQVAHLFEALGLAKYKPANQLLRRYIAKELPMGEYSRGAAIWALGKMLEGQKDDALADLLIDRLAEPVASIPSEMDLVRHMSAITLVRLGAKQHAPRIREFMGSDPVTSRNRIAMRWAVIELTGATLPDPVPLRGGLGFSFLEPAN